MDLPLTDRQREVLAIWERYAAVGRTPSYRKVAQELGVASVATIYKHVNALERKGYLTRVSPQQGFNVVVAVGGEPIKIVERWRGLALPEPLRWQVWERDGYQCLHCGSRQSLTVDHIQPWQMGGDKLDPENLQTLCRSCNSVKAQQTIDYRK